MLILYCQRGGLVRGVGRASDCCGGLRSEGVGKGMDGERSAGSRRASIKSLEEVKWGWRSSATRCTMPVTIRCFQIQAINCGLCLCHYPSPLRHSLLTRREAKRAEETRVLLTPSNSSSLLIRPAVRGGTASRRKYLPQPNLTHSPHLPVPAAMSRTALYEATRCAQWVLAVSRRELLIRAADSDRATWSGCMEVPWVWAPLPGYRLP